MAESSKVVIHYPFVPHYRVPIFNLLSDELCGDVQVWSAVASEDKFLKSDGGGWRFAHRKTFRFLIGKRFEVELGVLLRLIKTRPHIYVVLANPNILTSWLYPVMARLLGGKVLFWSHGMLKPAAGLKRALLWLYYRIPHGFLLYGERTIPWLEDLGIDKRYLHPIYNSLDYVAQAQLRQSQPSFDGRPNEVRLLVMGRLMQKLKIDMLLDFLARYKAQFPRKDIKLLIVGDGPEREALKRQAEDLGISDSVEFKGAVYDESVLASLYCSSSASVIMGVAGLAVMHSLAYGVPVITHSNLDGHCPEIEALLDNDAGIFFDEDNYESFASAVDSIGDVPNRSKVAIDVIEKKYTPEAQLALIREALNAYQ